MAADDKKIVDGVSKPGTTPPDSSAKPIIVSHKPMIKDPTVTDDANTESSEVPSQQEQKAPSSSNKVIEPLNSDAEEPKEDDIKSDEEESESSEESEKDSNEEAIIDTVVSQNESKNKDKKRDEQELKRVTEIENNIESKKYFVKVKAPKKKRNKRALLITLLVVLLGLVGVGLAADSELIKLPFDLPFDFIKKSQPSEEPTAPVNSSSQNNENKPDETTKAEEYIVPEGYLVYENKDLGFKFAYPKEYGTFTEQSTYSGTSVSELAGVSTYFESATPSAQTTPGTDGNFGLFNYDSATQAIIARKYSATVRLENDKWIVVEVNPADTVNQVGQEYKGLDGKAVTASDKNGIETYSFERTDEGCMHYALVFVSNNKLNELTLPKFCDGVSYSTVENPTPADKAPYNTMYQNVLNSIAKLN